MKLHQIIIFIIASVFLMQPAISQVTVTLSKKKEIVDGKTYIIHTVKQGETLYAISKAYNVLQKDIVFCNPSAFEGIRIGQELKIPVKTEGTKANSQLESSQYIYHITEKGQTAFFLTQHYNISMEELYKYNPELEHSALQAGQVVTIPKSGITQTAARSSTPYSLHTVKKKETLFSIAKSYNVDLNDILQINPEIDSNEPKVKIGQEIKIPTPGAKPIGLPVAASKADTIVIRQDLVQPSTDTSGGYRIDTLSVQEDSIGCVPTTQKEFRIAMLLPLFLAENSPASAPDSGMVKDEDGKFRYRNGQYWVYPRSNNALEFYEGALLALDSLKKQGLNAQVYVFDTMRDTTKMIQILKSPVMKDMDLIMGPFYTEMINQVARFAQENKIYYVSPVAINVGSLKNNPYLLQINAGEINSVGPMVDFISRQEHIHVTLIGNKSETDQTLFTAYVNKLKAVIPDSCLTIHQFRTDSIPLRPARYLKKKQNVVIIPVMDEAFVNILTGQLNNSAHNYKINLYGLAAWTKFVNLDLEYLHNLEFRYATAFHIDYNRPEIKKFLQQYRKYYFTEPTMATLKGGISTYPYQFSFLGYDAMFYFGSSLRQYGKGFGYCIPKFSLPMLQSDFSFKKIDPSSGYINTRLNIYRYTKDYTIVKDQ